MINIINLSIEQKKTIYKLCSLNDYKTVFKAKKISDKDLLVNMKKTLSSIKIEDINNYFEKHYFEIEDKVYNAIGTTINTKITEKYTDYRKITKIIDNKKYSEITDVELESIGKLEKNYPKEVFKMNFNEFIEFCSVPTDEEIESIKSIKKETHNEIKAEVKDDSKKKIELLSEKLDKQKEENKELKKSLKEKDDELLKANKEKQNILNKLSTSNICKRFDLLLPSGYKCKDASELYLKLSDLEQNAANSNDFGRLKEILAAKYSIVEKVEVE